MDTLCNLIHNIFFSYKQQPKGNFRDNISHQVIKIGKLYQYISGFTSRNVIINMNKKYSWQSIKERERKKSMLQFSLSCSSKSVQFPCMYYLLIINTHTLAVNICFSKLFRCLTYRSHSLIEYCDSFVYHHITINKCSEESEVLKFG